MRAQCSNTMTRTRTSIEANHCLFCSNFFLFKNLWPLVWILKPDWLFRKEYLSEAKLFSPLFFLRRFQSKQTFPKSSFFCGLLRSKHRYFQLAFNLVLLDLSPLSLRTDLQFFPSLYTQYLPWSLANICVSNLETRVNWG